MKRVFPQIAYLENSIVKKEKVRKKRLRDSHSSNVKQERVREKGFVIARIPS
jgi:hypothetical protein